MKSIRTLYKIGLGPSSSHTLGPHTAAMRFRDRYPEADAFRAVLYGSLAATGKGHGTDRAILTAIPQAEIVFDEAEQDLPHPNTMRFLAFCKGKTIGETRFFSIGGGSVEEEGVPPEQDPDVYAEKTMTEVIARCEREGLTCAQYVYACEGADIRGYLHTVWQHMVASIRRGLAAEGILPGGLGIERKAKLLHAMRCYNESTDTTNDRLVASFAYAVCEENACGHEIVTAPTCGSAGVLPAVMWYMQDVRGFPEEEIVDALAVAGLVGNIIRTNASISGAACGCQAEVGSACSMAAAALAALYGLSLRQIEYAAEVAMEHHLGLTCDPVIGLVQIPCIERNAVAAMRAMNAVNLARFLYGTRKISFDAVVETMYRTGCDLSEKYRETARGGLADLYE